MAKESEVSFNLVKKNPPRKYGRRNVFWPKIEKNLLIIQKSSDEWFQVAVWETYRFAGQSRAQEGRKRYPEYEWQAGKNGEGSALFARYCPNGRKKG